MNVARLVSAVQKALDEGVGPPTPSILNPEHYTGYRYLTTHVTASEGAFAALEDILGQEQDLALFNRGVLMTGGSGKQVVFHELVGWQP